MNWRRALATWFLIVIAESIHGTIRLLFIAPALGDLLARQVGVLIGSAIIFAIATTFIRWIGSRSFGERWPGLSGQDMTVYKWNVAPVYAAIFSGSVAQ
ncbi:MAG: hypothetical protein ABIJ12_03815 [bacterium]